MCDSDQEEYLYRFIGVDDAFLLDLKKTFAVVQVRREKESKNYVACILLNSKETCSSLIMFLSKCNIAFINHGVYISLVTDSDQAGFTVPDHILDLLRIYKGSLDVSFIMVDVD
jgi:hypothetical protein